MSKSILYSANSATQTLAAGDSVDFGSAVRKYGSNAYISGGNVVLQGSGYYDVQSSVTVSATAAGTIVATAYLNGTAIPGASASETLAADGVCTLTIPCITRTYCCSPSIYSVVISGIGATVSNAAVVVEKE